MFRASLFPATYIMSGIGHLLNVHTEKRARRWIMMEMLIAINKSISSLDEVNPQYDPKLYIYQEDHSYGRKHQFMTYNVVSE
jgi:hypothetical protein